MRFAAADGSTAPVLPDTARPFVRAVTPVNGATGVAVTSAVSGDVQRAGQSGDGEVGTVPVRANGSFVVAGTYAVSGPTVTFTPATAAAGRRRASA